METLEIKQTPAVIEFNYEALKSYIETELDRYDVSVTEETLADCKKLATELNKMRTDIDNRRKEAIKTVSAPIKEADDKLKSLVALIGSGRERLLEQISVFDKERLDELSKEIDAFAADLRSRQNVEPEFQTHRFDDLVILSNLTKTGNMTAKACNAVSDRIQQEKAAQDRTAMRLLDLENQCYKAGLEAPLERQHIQHFLFADDENYELQLKQMLAAEVNRQEAAARRRQQLAEEKEKRDAAFRKSQETPESDPEPETEMKPEPDPEPEPVKKVEPVKVEPVKVESDGKVGCTVTATFEIRVSPDTTRGTIETALRKNLERSGFKTLSSIDIKFSQ